MKQTRIPANSTQQGVVLIEALVAILLFSIGVLAISGLQAAMVKNTSESKFRSDAAYIAQQQVGDLWVRPDSLPADGTPVSAVVPALPNGQVVTLRTGDRYTVTVTWQQPGEEQHNFTTTATVAGNTSNPGI